SRGRGHVWLKIHYCCATGTEVPFAPLRIRRLVRKDCTAPPAVGFIAMPALASNVESATKMAALPGPAVTPFWLKLISLLLIETRASPVGESASTPVVLAYSIDESVTVTLL